MDKVLVTGGAGFIGSHTCKALAAHGFLPVTSDDLFRGHADFVRYILHPAALHAAFERHRPGAVIHFAALAYGESMARPLPYYRVNVAHRVLEFVRNVWHSRPSIRYRASVQGGGCTCSLG